MGVAPEVIEQCQAVFLQKENLLEMKQLHLSKSKLCKRKLKLKSRLWIKEAILLVGASKESIICQFSWLKKALLLPLWRIEVIMEAKFKLLRIQLNAVDLGGGQITVKKKPTRKTLKLKKRVIKKKMRESVRSIILKWLSQKLLKMLKFMLNISMKVQNWKLL